MSEINPPLVLEAGSHDADLLRQLWGDTYTPGVMAADHLEVTEQATPALGVTVAAGRAIVAGDEASSQGVYSVSSDDDVDVALATADATNDRIDLIVARVLDSFYSGALDEWELQAVTGTPAATPSAPAAPSNSEILAAVLVPADAGGNPAITDADITDLRETAKVNLAPLGEVGYTEATTDVGSITGSAVDTTAELTHTFVSGRIYRVSLGWGGITSTVAGDRARVRFLVDGAASRDRIILITASGTADLGGVLSHRLACPGDIAAGSRPVKGQAFRHSGTGTLTVQGSATAPRYLLVEDLGPA
jgi:hypothetical protein